jgi:hypothetical protein
MYILTVCLTNYGHNNRIGHQWGGNFKEFIAILDTIRHFADAKYFAV